MAGPAGATVAFMLILLAPKTFRDEGRERARGVRGAGTDTSETVKNTDKVKRQHVRHKAVTASNIAGVGRREHCPDDDPTTKKGTGQQASSSV